jgi:formylglycine-generating enzyme required for sulfatase activity
VCRSNVRPTSVLYLAVLALGCRVAGGDRGVGPGTAVRDSPVRTSTDLLPAVVFPLGLDTGSPYDMTRAVGARKPIVLAGSRAAHECHVRGDMVVDAFSMPHAVTEVVDGLHFPWLAGASGALHVEYQGRARLRLEDGFVARGIGQCDGVTHISEVIDVGDWMRVTGSVTVELDGEPFLIPLKVVLRTVKVEQHDASGPKRHLEPMVYIEGGAFEGTLVEPFWIDRWEVGVASYRECIEAGYCMDRECVEPGYCEGLPKQIDSTSDEPVFFVRQLDADVYCTWAGKRLPTLREWQWAARGREEARAFPWGEQMVDCTRAQGTAIEPDDPCADPDVERRGNRPLGASRDGVEDLAGNVEEWVAEPRTSAGSSAHDYFDEVDLGEFTTRAKRQEYRPTSGIRCAADKPTADVLSRSQPQVRTVSELRIVVHDNQGLRTPDDARAYCDAFESSSVRRWRIPSMGVLVELRERLDLASVPYWTADDVDGYKRTLCIADID